MPAVGRPPEPALIERIAARAVSFDFFQLVHLLETLEASAARIGETGPVDRERVRLRPDPGLVFQPSDVRRVERGDASDRNRPESWSWRVTVAFMGLYGAASPTPVYLSELIGFTDVDADELVDLLDLFNHRILAMYYRAWLKYRYPYRYQPGAKDEFSSYVLSVAGLRDERVRSLTRVNPARLLGYLGLLSMRTRPAAGLARMLGDWLQVPVAVEQWQLRWVPVPDEARNRLGMSACTLGVDCTLGERVPDRSGKIRVAVGPLPMVEFRATLPDTERFRTLGALVRVWNADRFEHDVEVRVHGEEIRPLELSAGGQARLGWSSWVCSESGVAGTPGVVFQARPIAGV